MSLRLARPATILSLLWLSAGPAAAAETWRPGPDMAVGRSFFALVPLPSGDLLAPGGVAAGSGSTNRVDLFSLAGQSFGEIRPMPNSHRYHHMAVLLGDGKLLIAGGFDGTNYLRTSELFQAVGKSRSDAGNDRGVIGNQPAAPPIPAPSREPWRPSPLFISLGALGFGVLVAAASLALSRDR
jgi:hypothetical protein